MATKKNQDEQGKTLKVVPRPEVEYIDTNCICGLPAGHHGGCQNKGQRTHRKKTMLEKIEERKKKNNPA